MDIKFDYKVNEFILFCKENDIDIYLVGGATRDFLLNKECFDLDFCLTSDYTRAFNILNREYEIDVNDKYQSIKFNIGKYNIEISHARKEKEYLDYRHPNTIEFTDSIVEDSKRRDFTINALYYKDGEIYDFYNGNKDLNNRILRVIGDIVTRFREDPLRILRMIRFSCLGFIIDDNDKKVILDNGYLLKELTLSSFNKEFDKILDINSVETICEFKDILEDYFDVKFNDLSKLNNLISIEQKKTYLGIKNKSNLYKYRDLKIENSKEYLAKLIYKMGKDIVKELVIYHDLIMGSKIIELFNDIIAYDFYNKSQLDITSIEIIELINKKEFTSYYLDMISYAIIEGKLENKKEKIINYIVENVK